MIREKVMQETASEARDSVKDVKESPMILHFDGKIVQELTKRRKLTIALSVNCVCKNTLLGIPSYISSTGEWQKEVITDSLKSYELKEERRNCWGGA